MALLTITVWMSIVVSGDTASVNSNVVHLVNRLSYGARPGDIERVTQLGVDRYLQQQLNPATIAEPQALSQQIDSLTTLQKTPVELYQWYQSFNPRESQNKQNRDPQAQQLEQRTIRRQILEETLQARVLRAVESDRQLQEQMVDFWFNHFNVFYGKGLTRLWIGQYEREAIRPHAFGKFRELLGVTARHPAMLYYLDNWQNTAPDSPGARGRFKGLNENYARELMELHTLGVNGGYSQQDVVNLAKIFTGWGLSHRQPQGDSSGFYFDEKRHDFNDKTLLGQTIQGSGIREGEQALDILAKHPATARHLSYKLAQYFVADQPPQPLVDRLSKRFTATDGDIRLVLETLFKSPEFWDDRAVAQKFKTPYQYVISAMRVTEMKVTNVSRIQATLEQLGMPLYGCQTPDGYKNTEAAWLNPDAMTRRLSLATALSRGQFQNRQQAGTRQTFDANQLMKTLGDRFSETTRNAISTSPPNLRAALVLGSPEFMRR